MRKHPTVWLCTLGVSAHIFASLLRACLLRIVTNITDLSEAKFCLEFLETYFDRGAQSPPPKIEETLNFLVLGGWHDGPQILAATVLNSVAHATWLPRFVYPHIQWTLNLYITYCVSMHNCRTVLSSVIIYTAIRNKHSHTAIRKLHIKTPL